MSVIKVKDETGEFIDISAIQGKQGKQGEQGPQGPAGADGTSINVIQAVNEEGAINLSQANPDNIYYWVE